MERLFFNIYKDWLMRLMMTKIGSNLERYFAFEKYSNTTPHVVLPVILNKIISHYVI